MRSLVACVLLAGCASQPIPAEQQDAYFSCPGIIVDTASENLQRAGYITAWRAGDQAIETKWVSYTLTDSDDRRTLFLRYLVEASDEGVSFTIYERSDDARGEAPWDRITRSQVEDRGVVELLEKIRRDVCGSETRFFSRTSTVQ